MRLAPVWVYDDVLWALFMDLSCLPRPLRKISSLLSQCLLPQRIHDVWDDSLESAVPCDTRNVRAGVIPLPPRGRGERTQP